MAPSFKFNPNDPSTFGDLLKNAGQYKQFDVELPGGIAIRNINTQADIDGALAILKQMNANVSQNLAPPPQPLQNTAIAPPVQGGTPIDEIIARFATRKVESLQKKTHYEYGNYQKKFSAWIATRKNNEAFPIRLVTREDIAAYIDDLKHKGLANRTIQNKYMSAIAGLFELAETSGAYPKGDNPARGHKLFTKSDQKKGAPKTQYKPFTDEDLALIFKPENLMARTKPDDYWLPILALFTGGRIGELCQLANSDIKQVGDLWAISINDEDYKTVKSEAARRIVPIHPTLIKLGFLDYVAEAKQHGPMLFPYLNDDKFGKFIDTPSERFGEYLDSLGITDKKKVFHSLRKTSNNTLKQNGISEETRCQYVGHEHDTTNSSDYSEQHSLEYLAENVATKLTFEVIPFDNLTHPTGHFSHALKRLCAVKARLIAKRELNKERSAAIARREKALAKKI